MGCRVIWKTIWKSQRLAFFGLSQPFITYKEIAARILYELSCCFIRLAVFLTIENLLS